MNYLPDFHALQIDDEYLSMPLVTDERKAFERLYEQFDQHRAYYCGRLVRLGATNATNFANAPSIDDVNDEIEAWANPHGTLEGAELANSLKVSIEEPNLTTIGWTYWGYQTYRLDDDPPELNTQASIKANLTAIKAWLMLGLRIEQMAWDLRMVDRPAIMRRRRGRPRH